jgi:exopolyphosphatase/guanosine-5'-triphosphate,3'-diphosphate pyrophosphatase
VSDRVHPSLEAIATAWPDTLAAIDIGTNSVHMVIARVDVDGRFEVLTRHKEMVRLGETGDDHLKVLTDAAIDRGVAALARCRAMIDTYGAQCAAVATSAVREADNRKAFLRRARKEAGIEVEVIAGHEEARLIHLGVLQALPLYDQHLLLCDIGGGSTELLIGHRGEDLVARSFKLGAIRLTQRHFPDGVTSRKSIERARRAVRATIVPFVRDARRHPIDTFVGSSGTIENLVAMAQSAAGLAPQSVNGATLTRAELGEVMDALAEARTSAGRAALPGIDTSRADIIVGGAVIIEQVMDALELDRLTFSEYALREGVLFDLRSRLRGATSRRLSDLRRHSVDHLMELCDEDPEHSVQVARLAVQLFDGLVEEHHLGDAEREWLEAAALLANVGLFISHSRHHLHSYYVIRNSEHLSGFTDHEIEVIAQVARYHRRGEPSAKHAPYAALDELDQRRVAWMAAILRVAIGLDRSLCNAVAAVSVRSAGGIVTVELLAADDADVSMELYEAGERSALLRRQLGRPVDFVVA